MLYIYTKHIIKYCMLQYFILYIIHKNIMYYLINIMS